MNKAEDANGGHGWNIVYWCKCKAIIYYNTKEILERVTSVWNKIFYLFQRISGFFYKTENFPSDLKEHEVDQKFLNQSDMFVWWGSKPVQRNQVPYYVAAVMVYCTCYHFMPAIFFAFVLPTIQIYLKCDGIKTGTVVTQEGVRTVKIVRFASAKENCLGSWSLQASDSSQFCIYCSHFEDYHIKERDLSSKAVECSCLWGLTLRKIKLINLLPEKTIFVKCKE